MHTSGKRIPKKKDLLERTYYDGDTRDTLINDSMIFVSNDFHFCIDCSTKTLSKFEVKVINNARHETSQL